MKVVAITNAADAPPGWWRITKPFEWLNKHGVETDIQWVNNLHDLEGAAVVLHRINSPEPEKFIEMIRSHKPRKIVYEVDDDIFTDAFVTFCADIGALKTQLDRIEDDRVNQVSLMQMCDEVTVTTSYLKSVVYNFTKKPIHVVPNALDVRWFQERVGTPHVNEPGIITIGWAGGMRPKYDLEMLAQAWTYIDKKYKHVRFVIGGFQPNDVLYEAVDYDKIIYIPHQKNINNWPRTMNIDIGCAPLSVSSFSKSKSPIKVFEYWAAGAAVVASDVVYRDVVSPIRDGLIAQDTEDWKAFLMALIEMPEMRQSLANAGLETLKTKYSMEVNYTNWITAYES